MRLKASPDIRRSTKKMFEMESWPTSSTKVTPSPNVRLSLRYPHLTEAKDQGLFFFPKVKDKPLLIGGPLARSVSTMVRPRTTVISSSIFVTQPGETIGTIPAPPYANRGRRFGGFKSQASLVVYRPTDLCAFVIESNHAGVRRHECRWPRNRWISLRSWIDSGC